MSELMALNEEEARSASGTHTDCRTSEGVTVGLVDAIITMSRLLRGRERTPAVIQALMDLKSDEDFANLCKDTTEE